MPDWLHVMWTPRMTHLKKDQQLFPLKHKAKLPFVPQTSPEYSAPPAPLSNKKRASPKKEMVPAAELQKLASDLKREADALQKRSDARAPSLGVQLGLVLLSRSDYVKRVIKEWDTKGKGEFLKGEFRLNLRSVGLNAGSVEADELFDSWDADGGGTLDTQELTSALHVAMQKARVWKNTTDPNRIRADALRRRSALAAEAATSTQEAEQLTDELAELERELETKADIRLGELLSKRRIKPGTVVSTWVTSRGPHAGELSRAEFRACAPTC